MTKKKLAGRLLQMVIVLIGISFLTFLLTYLAPGDPVQTMYASSGMVPSQEIIEQTREQMGLNKPFLVQYVNWLGDVLHGDFGTSYAFGKPVLTLMASRLWPTLKLALVSMVFMLIVSIPLGMLSAVYKNKWIDYLVRGITFLGISIPNFWVGLLLMLVFCVYVHIFPVICSGGDFKSLVLPAATLAIAMSAKYTRQVRTAVLDELSQDYVTGARARGIKEWRVLWTNVFPNSLLPLITMLGQPVIISGMNMCVANVLVDGYYNSSMIYSKNVGYAHIHTADYYWLTTEITPAE